MIYFICLCLLIDVIWVIYLYNKTDNFIIKKDKEAKDLEQRHLIQHRHWNRRSGGSVTIKKDKKFDLLKRKLGGA